MTFNYDANGLFSVIYNGVTYYYVQNAQGDVIAITNASGTRVVEYTYDAWGNILSTTGSMRLTLGTTQPFRYRGYVYDSEMGLYYLQSRYYDPALGRFICADGLLTTGQGLSSYNMFAYCLNNPISLIDDSGCKPKSPYEYDYGNGIVGYTDTGTGNKSGKQSNVKQSSKQSSLSASSEKDYRTYQEYGYDIPLDARLLSISIKEGPNGGIHYRTNSEVLFYSSPKIARDILISFIFTGSNLAVTGAIDAVMTFLEAGNTDISAGEYRSIVVTTEYEIKNPLSGEWDYMYDKQKYIIVYPQNGIGNESIVPYYWFK